MVSFYLDLRGIRRCTLALLLVASINTLPSANAQSKPVKVSGEESHKLLIEPHVQLHDLGLVHMAHATGEITMEFTVLPDGTTTDIQKVEDGKSVNMGGYLVLSAKDAISKWKYHPYLVGGSPAAMRTTIHVKVTEGAEEILWK